VTQNNLAPTREGQEMILPPESPGGVQPYSPEPKPRRSGCLWGIAGGIGCLLVALLIPTVLVLLGITSINGIIGGIGGIFGAGAPASAAVISSQTIVQGIQPLGQLVSVSVQLAKADIRININQGVLNASGYGASHVAQGAVEAGVDLTRIGENSLTYDQRRESYVLIVPAPELTSCRVDYIRQYDRTFTTLGVDWDEARLLASYMALTEFRDDAIEGGILTRAEAETQLVLGNFVRVLTGHPVEIIFQPPETPVIPASCQPETPAGWTYADDANDYLAGGFEPPADSDEYVICFLTDTFSALGTRSTASTS
jgi:hypothetical protein